VAQAAVWVIARPDPASSPSRLWTWSRRRALLAVLIALKAAFVAHGLTARTRRSGSG
jgi:hypothetical protein